MADARDRAIAAMCARTRDLTNPGLDMNVTFPRATHDADTVEGLAAALRDFRADYTAALDVIARLTEGAFVLTDTEGAWWGYPDVDGKDFGRCLTDGEWRAYCDAAQRATHPEVTT